MIKEYIPIGSVVSLYDASQKILIVGYLQKNNQDDKLWDYVGVLYPNGYLTPSRMVLFDREQIEKKYYMGCQNVEQFQFQEQLSKQGSEVEEIL